MCMIVCFMHMLVAMTVTVTVIMRLSAVRLLMRVIMFMAVIFHCYYVLVAPNSNT